MFLSQAAHFDHFVLWPRAPLDTLDTLDKAEILDDLRYHLAIDLRYSAEIAEGTYPNQRALSDLLPLDGIGSGRC